VKEGMGGGRRKRETTEIKTRELLASPLISPTPSHSLSLSLSRSFFLCLSFFLSLFAPAVFLPLSRYVSAAETKKCNLPLLGDTLPCAQPSLVRLAPTRRGWRALNSRYYDLDDDLFSLSLSLLLSARKNLQSNYIRRIWPWRYIVTSVMPWRRRQSPLLASRCIDLASAVARFKNMLCGAKEKTWTTFPRRARIDTKGAQIMHIKSQIKIGYFCCKKVALFHFHYLPRTVISVTWIMSDFLSFSFRDIVALPIWIACRATRTAVNASIKSTEILPRDTRIVNDIRRFVV